MLITCTNPFTVSIIITIDRILLLNLLYLLYFVVLAVTPGMNLTLSAGNWTFCATKIQLSWVSKPLWSTVTSLDGSGEKYYFISIYIFNRRGTHPSKSCSLLVLPVLTLPHETAILSPTQKSRGSCPTKSPCKCLEKQEHSSSTNAEAGSNMHSSLKGFSHKLNCTRSVLKSQEKTSCKEKIFEKKTFLRSPSKNLNADAINMMKKTREESEQESYSAFNKILFIHKKSLLIHVS